RRTGQARREVPEVLVQRVDGRRVLPRRGPRQGGGHPRAPGGARTDPRRGHRSGARVVVLLAAPRPATHSVLLQSIISGGRLTPRDSIPAMLTSQALDWPGVLVEAGKNDVAAVDDVVGDQHYLSLNVDTKPLTLEVKGPTGFRQFTILPLSVWVSPGFDPLTLRLNSALSYLRVALDTLHLGRLMGRSPDEDQPVRLRRTYGVASPQIARLMLTLKDEADSRTPCGLAVVED